MKEIKIELEDGGYQAFALGAAKKGLTVDELATRMAKTMVFAITMEQSGGDIHDPESFRLLAEKTIDILEGTTEKD